MVVRSFFLLTRFRTLFRYFLGISLPDILKSILPNNHLYLIKNFNEPSSYQTAENFKVPQFELDVFVDVDNQEKVCEWFKEYESWSKTIMPRGYGIKGDRVLFREQCHCIHKQGKNVVTKRPQSLQARDICNSSYTFTVRIPTTFTYTSVKEEVREELLELFKDGHSSSSALYVYQDKLHLEASDEQELIKLLADRSVNPDYDYVTWESQW
ncbi:hypothetical protein RclHR1_00640027 [Rhizophagus clarus]|uniref:Uncharacterized protein n=1 Tax=Rhizophagus clarus TaxID=94130 RepID=A0A2Z6SIQ8_9GLOM|nr:hypothetical protein RclHR1_00640027 [Rhizophagus clarus]